MKALLHPPFSPLQEIKDKLWTEQGVRFFIKRDDLLVLSPSDPFCGNKWRKLKYNLMFAQEKKLERILSFGGAYSNHIAALASAGKHFNFQTIGIIRGEQVHNATLDRAVEDGMQLYFIDRTSYRRKKEKDYLQELQKIHGPCYVIPEGGTNELALKGSEEIISEIENQCSMTPTHIAMACGTGGTLAGVIRGLSAKTNGIGVSVLKGNFMTKEIANLLGDEKKVLDNWQVLNKYHHGGYAKRSDELMAFIDRFQVEYGIQLEPIYTGKLFYALFDLLKQGHFSSGSVIVGVHTGGLQGWQK